MFPLEEQPVQMVQGDSSRLLVCRATESGTHRLSCKHCLGITVPASAVFYFMEEVKFSLTKNSNKQANKQTKRSVCVVCVLLLKAKQ